MEKNIDLSKTKKTIVQFIQENFLMYQDEDVLDENTSFIDEGIIDSTGVLEIITFLEETFDIKIDDEELVPENLDSIARISRFVVRKREAAEETPESKAV